MAKITRQISLDYDVNEFIKINYHGEVSGMINDYLRALMGDNFKISKLGNKKELIKNLEGDLAKAKIEQLQFDKEVERRKNESLKEENQRIEEFMQSDQFFLKMKEMQTLKDMSSKFAVERYEIVMNSLIHDTGQNRAEIEKMIASKLKPTTASGLNTKKHKG